MKKSTLFIIIILAACVAISCKKSCNLSPKEGYKIVGDDKDCYYELIDSQTFDPKITSITDLNSKLEAIKKELAAGNAVQLEMINSLMITETQFTILQDFGVILKDNAGKISIAWNGNSVCPAQPNILLTYAEWTEWNKLPLGAHDNSGAKTIIKFVVGENEITLFINDGQEGEILIKGAPIVNIFTHTDLHAAPQKIIELYEQYQELPIVWFSKSLALDNGADMTAMLALITSPNLKDKFEFYSKQQKQSFATDSVAVQSATILFLMNQHKLLAAHNFGDKKYAFILNAGDWNWRDSVPSDNVVRFPRVNANKLTSQNMLKYVPNEIDVTEPWSVEIIPQQFYTGWNKDIKLNAADAPDMPGGKVNLDGVTNQFLGQLEEPVGKRKNGVPFAFVAPENMILSRFMVGNTPPP